MDRRQHVVTTERREIDRDLRLRTRSWTKLLTQRRQIRQSAGVEFPVDRGGQLGFAAAFVRQGQQFDRDLAGPFVADLGAQGFERPRVSRTWKQLAAVDQVEQRHRLLAQRVDHMAVIDNMASLAV
jgi:hypothetical protein